METSIYIPALFEGINVIVRVTSPDKQVYDIEAVANAETMESIGDQLASDEERDKALVTEAERRYLYSRAVISEQIKLQQQQNVVG